MKKPLTKKLLIIAFAATVCIVAFANFTPPQTAATKWEYAVLYESIKWQYENYDNTKKKEFHLWFKSGEDNPAQKKVMGAVKNSNHISDALNTLGELGWEMVDSHYEEGETWSSQAFYFKRPKT